jgi:N-dimethylarginine dimethylaminohydrolase
MADRTNPHTKSAYGGEGWQPRLTALSEELGTRRWASSGINSEYGALKQVLLYRPGKELASSVDFKAVQMLEPLDVARAIDQHDAMAQAYCDNGVKVHYAEVCNQAPTPNQMFMADLFCMTPEGAIIARPASEVRAGEERWAARKIAELGMPIVRSVSGHGTFEGADLLWLNPETAIIGCGLRTNEEAISQIGTVLEEMGVETIAVDMPFGTMHLMGMIRILDKDLVLAWPVRIAHRAVNALRNHGYNVVFAPDEKEARDGMAFNLVTLGPRKVLMAAGNPITQQFFEDLGVECVTTPVDELAKAAGAIGCLSGILEREKV